jgi:hypothetical protein
MATFAELVTASANSGLVEKIKIATLVAADNIRVESTGAPPPPVPGCCCTTERSARASCAAPG